MPNTRISVLVALEGADEGLKRAIQSAEGSFEDLADSAKDASSEAEGGMEELSSGVETFGDQIDAEKTALLAFVGIPWVVEKAQQIVEIADAWNLMVARLKLATAGQREFVTAQTELFAIAQRIGVPIAEVATLYGKLQVAVRQLGGEQRTAFNLTESISQALRLSGASAQEAGSALLQLGQGLGSGVLRGEEFNSVVEASPRLAQAMADGLNVPIGRLRKMAEQGQLTADVVIGALLSQKDKLAAEYDQLPLTVTASFERLSNVIVQWVAKVDAATGFTQKLSLALDWLARNFDTVVGWLKVLAEVSLAVLIYRLIPALITAWQLAGTAAVTAAANTSAAWAIANLSMSGALAAVGKLKVAFAVLASAVVGWEVGTFLQEQFQAVRMAGIFMVQVLEGEFEKLKYAWESVVAVFSGDTLAAATERHNQRLQQMRSIFGDMYADATDASRAAAAAMDATTAAAEEMAQRLEAVRQGAQEAVGRGLEALDGAVDKLKAQLGAVEQAASQANQSATEAIAGISAAYQSLTGIIESGLQQQTAANTAYYAQKYAQLMQSQLSERELIQQTTQVTLEGLNRQSELRAQALAETLRLIEQEGRARLYAAQRQAETDEVRRAVTLRIENEILAAKQQALTQALADYTRHVDALNAEANRHLAEIRKIEDEKRALQQSTDDKIRDLQRSTMSAYEQYQDKLTQIADLQQKARTAINQGEFDQAVAFAKQAQDLAAQTAQVVKAGDEVVVTQKQAVRTAIDSIRTSEELAIQALQGEGRAHQQAADEATSARRQIESALRGTAEQIEQIKTQLQAGLKFAIDVDASKLDAALKSLDENLREKAYLVRIDADLQAAQLQLRALEDQLKDGKTLLVDADTRQAKAALDTLHNYAVQSGQMDLKLATEKAQASLRLVESQIRAMGQIRTESLHVVTSNAAAARAEIQSLNGQNTSSTHTIYVKKVEQHASGGWVGAGLKVRRYARGGVATRGIASNGADRILAFPKLTGGNVPGSGNGDTVPRTLDSGAFVLKKAAVRKYGAATLAKLEKLAHFATGGMVSRSSARSALTGTNDDDGAQPRRSLGASSISGSSSRSGHAERSSIASQEDSRSPPTVKKNREVTEVLKIIDLGLRGVERYATLFNRNTDIPVEAGMVARTMLPLRLRAEFDRRNLMPMQGVKTLTSFQNGIVGGVKEHWMMALKTGLRSGVDMERELIDYMEQQSAQQVFYARGGVAQMAASDTIPAMLTPGEFVVNRSTVQRLGAGFFSALNNLQLPARSMSEKVRGYARGGLVSPGSSGGVASLLRGMPTDLEGLVRSTASPRMPTFLASEASAPSKTIRVELASGNRSLIATIPARDEHRLLELLREAQSRT